MGDERLDRIARRIARELKAGDVVNCGIGIPGRVPNFVPPDVEVIFQAENGPVGIGPDPPEGEEDWQMTNASIRPVTLIRGGAITDSVEAFSLMRSRLDVGIIGALEVDRGGNLANWKIPGRVSPGIGGAMDLCQAKRLIVATQHVTREGEPKLLERCTLPLTAKGRVKLVVTDMAVVELTPEGFLLREVAEGTTVEEVKRATGAPLRVAERVGTFA